MIIPHQKQETKEITFGNDIIYGLTLISHYVVAVTKEYMKMYDLKDQNFNSSVPIQTLRSFYNFP